MVLNEVYAKIINAMNGEDRIEIRKHFMDLFFPGLVLVITLIWKDFITSAIKLVFTKIGATDSSSMISLWITAVLATGLGIYIAVIKNNWDKEYKKLNVSN